MILKDLCDIYAIDRHMRSIYKRVDYSQIIGDVLYLGMGSMWVPRNQGNRVKSTTIIEKYQKIIDRFSSLANTEWEILKGDIYKYIPNKTYDVIFADIFIIPFTYAESIEIINLYKEYLKPGGKIIFLEKLLDKTTLPKNKILGYVKP